MRSFKKNNPETTSTAKKKEGVLCVILFKQGSLSPLKLKLQKPELEAKKSNYSA